MTTKNYSAGKPGEEFYRHVIGPYDYPGELIEDTRNNHIEGDFSVGKVYKNIIEVKGDHVCFRKDHPTGRLPIEIVNENNADGKGWFYHCRMDNVDEIIFVCYNGQDKMGPTCSIRVPFLPLEAYVEAKLEDTVYREKNYRHTTDYRTGKKTYNLCVPLEELYSQCGATLATVRLEVPPEARAAMQAILEANGIDGTLGPYMHLSIPEEYRIGGRPRE